MNRVKPVFALLLIALGTCSCDRNDRVGDYDCSVFTRAHLFWGRKPEIRLAEIREFPLEKQYAVALCSIAVMRPPTWVEARPFVERRASAIAFLKTRLPSVHDDVELDAILQLVETIDNYGFYPVPQDEELMSALEISVSAMRAPLWKTDAEKVIMRLKARGSSQPTQ